MTYWNGSRWIPDAPERTARVRGRIGRRLLGASGEAALITLLMFGLIASTTLAAKGGHGGKPDGSVATCHVEGNVITTAGLPTYEVINFTITDQRGTTGWVLGITWEGDWSLTVPERSGPTTYEFVSRTWGLNGSKYTVYSSCAA